MDEEDLLETHMQKKEKQWVRNLIPSLEEVGLVCLPLLSEASQWLLCLNK